MEFESDEAAKAFYVVYAGRLGFATRIRRSCRSTRDDSFILRRFVCTKEGYYNDLCRDATKFAREGATSVEMYHFAKDTLQKAFAQIVAAKNGVSGRWAV
ncbi:Protein FAR1-RELATED SEQUENCE 5 [Acorus gramineus]|uniref:Protein FAR1-RELATED SEQUENCE 5 n=1 Tax=Acorus gramineus TaxID=55184 RepID=A0AAV9AE78_ACOGR|nr:Protein FAR1-RELATED SEQUENCE 5 [Acorus gramineus]